ncbi:MAG: hypothetical protein ABWX74_17980 [Aeromicrobium sp.]
MPRHPSQLSAAALRVAEVTAVVPGRVLQGVFGAVALVRSAAKPLHPSGRLHPVVIRSFGLTGTDRVDVPWIDEPGESDGIARFSRATGLPAALPDIHGLAIRIADADEEGTSADILMATTGLGPVSRFVLRPSRTPAESTYSTLFPYSTSGGALLLAAVPDLRDPARLFLVLARPRGDWRVFGDLMIEDSDAARTGDESISFDPIVHQIEGLAYYAWATRLREGAYRAARRTRGDSAEG